jgi:NADPH:quinone reductase-like Zn-dependent oxidoreductase
VRAATGGRGADVIYDPVGGDVFDLSTKCIAFAGRLLVIGFASGRIPTIEANRILLKNIAIVGLHWGAYRTHDPTRIAEAQTALFALYEAGAVTPVVSATYPLPRAAAALAEIASCRSVGKVVLTPGALVT